MNKSTWLVITVLVILFLLSAVACFIKYRDMAAMEDRIEDDRARVENIIQRRNALIPGLVCTVKGYAPHEEEIFDHVARARVELAEATDIGGLMEANMLMGRALTGVMTIADTCLPLKDDRTFNELRNELAEVEDRIAVECRNYNGSVGDYNLYLAPFPNHVIAGIFGFERDDTSLDVPEEAAGVLALDSGGAG